jgi:NAD+ kinase
MRVGLYSRGIDHQQQPQVVQLLKELSAQNIRLVLHQSLLLAGEGLIEWPEGTTIFEDHEDLDPGIDCMISLGGDGTLLDTVTQVRDKNIPILGINFGRLGFLASLGRNELSNAVDALVNGTYVVDKRSLIHVDANIPLFGNLPFGLNEFTIHKRDTSPMIKIHTYLNGEFLNSYWADGLIVSTPTGSTGYNMSCNGPIVFPESASFVIVPIAPHNLNVRPIIVPDSTIVSFEVEGRSEDFICTLDSRREIVGKDIQLAVKKEQFNVSLVRLNEGTFLSTLRSKLTWGLDKRN